MLSCRWSLQPMRFWVHCDHELLHCAEQLCYGSGWGEYKGIWNSHHCHPSQIGSSSGKGADQPRKWQDCQDPKLMESFCLTVETVCLSAFISKEEQRFNDTVSQAVFFLVESLEQIGHGWLLLISCCLFTSPKPPTSADLMMFSARWLEAAAALLAGVTP